MASTSVSANAALAARYASPFRSTIFSLFALCGFTAPAAAESFRQFTNDLNYSLESLMDHVMPQGVYDLRLGVGTAVVPKYQGDNNTHITAVPVLAARYKDIVFLDGSQVRFNLLDLHQTPGSHPFSAGPLIRLDFGRDESDSRDLRGLGGVGTSFEMGGFVNYNIGPGRIRGTIRQDVASGHRGTIATVDMGLLFYHDSKIRLAAQTGVTWSSARYLQSFFGVTPAQSMASGLPVYHPGSGLKSWAISVGGEYEFIQQWSLGVKLDYERLMNGAADSPLVRLRGSPNQFAGGTFVIYSF